LESAASLRDAAREVLPEPLPSPYRFLSISLQWRSVSRVFDLNASQPFTVGRWRVDPGLNRLTDGAQTVAIDPRTMDLLVCLVRRAGETVSKETLLEEVWKGAFVSEGVISKTLSALRDALGDDAAAPTFILTVPRRGYRLVARVEVSPGNGMPTAPDFPVEGTVAAAPREGASATEAAKTGKSAPGLRGYGTAIVGLFVVGALGWLVHASGKRLAPGTAPQSAPLVESVDRLLLEGRHLWAQRGFESVRRANDLFVLAAREAPESAEARGWLALSMLTRASYLGEGASACDAAAEEAAKALAIDPDSAVAHCARGAIALHRDFDPPTAIAAHQQALVLDPGFAPARQFLAEALTIAGRHGEALEVIEEALEAEPLSAVLHGVKGLVLLRADRPLAALEAYDRVLVLEPRFSWVHHNRAMPLARLGRTREAAEALYLEAQLLQEDPEQLAILRSAIDGEGLRGYWTWRVNRIEAQSSRGGSPVPVIYAESLAGAGRLDEALSELAKPPQCPNADYFFYLRDSPGFDALRGTEPFRAIYRPFESL
jgi:DNA-binding winged helix-turn-helix (wHTH) protein/tetratricopeptide (TPR) repeat protein